MKFARFAAAGALMLLLNSCFLQPGKFTSAMTITRDGSFTYRYTGEIHLFSYKKMMEDMMKTTAEPIMGEFDPEGVLCWDDEPEYDAAADAAADAAVANAAVAASEAVADSADTDSDGNVSFAVINAAAETEAEGRPCTAEELAQKKKDWDEERAAQQERQAQQKKEMAEMFGGMDPSDPKTLDEFARRLEGQDGWKKVTHRGDGVFDVDYEISGRLDHDFVFPVYPGFKYIIPFVELTMRKDGRVFVIAPAFTGASADSASGAGANIAMMGAGKGGMGGVSYAEGTLTLTTDAEILTNNTQDGPTSGENGMRVLSWLVSPLDSKVPEALLKM